MTQAFSYCHSLKNVILPSTLCVMGDLVFRGCSSLEELDFPSPALNGALERIGAEVFRDCVSLRRVHLPKTLKKIEANAFAGCSALKNIELPDSVQQIELLAFCECTSLTSLFIPKNVEKIEVGAFKGCKNLKRIYCETKFAPSDWHESFQNCHPDLKIVWGVSREQAKKMENN